MPELVLVCPPDVEVLLVCPPDVEVLLVCPPDVELDEVELLHLMCPHEHVWRCCLPPPATAGAETVNAEMAAAAIRVLRSTGNVPLSVNR